MHDPQNHLANALQLHQAGDLNAAARIYEAILAHDANHADARHFLGVVHYQRGQIHSAIDDIQQAIRLQPSNATYYHNLGEVYLAANDLAAAENAYRQAIAIRPNYPDAHNHLGVVLKEQGRPNDAAVHIEHALKLRVDYAEAYNNLGNVRQDQQRLDNAVDCYRHALKLNPDFTDAYNNLGRALLDQGEFQAATDNYLQAIEMNPRHVKAYFSLSTQRSYQPSEAHIERLEELSQLHELGSNDRAFAAFALANILDRQQRYDEAFAAYRMANQLKEVEFDISEHRQFVTNIIETFDANFMNSSIVGSDSTRPIFIIGMPRSGTTLVEQILCSHPDVYGAGELDSIAKIASILPQVAGSNSTYPCATEQLDQHGSERLANSYLDHIARKDDTAARVTDKMPGNFHHLGLIQLLFPNAALIHCRRNALDVCLSCYFQNFGTVDYSFDLANLGAFYQEYDRIMKHWAQVLKMPILDVEYEQLISDQETISRRIVQHCRLEWNDQCMSFHETKRAIKTMSVWQARQPIYRTSVQRWKNYERHLQPLKDALGPCCGN